MDRLSQTLNFQDLLLNSHAGFALKNVTDSSILVEKRRNALSLFSKQGFPTVDNEEWKYTNISALLKKDFSFDVKSSLEENEFSYLYYPNLRSNKLVFLNGTFSPEYSSIIESPGHIIISSISDAEEEDLKNYFGKTEINDDPFSLINMAYASNGVIIRIPEKRQIVNPIVVYYISDSRFNNTFSQPRTLIVVEKDANAHIVESFHTIGNNTSFSNCVTEIFLKENSNLHYYKLQNEADNSYHIGNTGVVHIEKSFFTSNAITFSGEIVRNNLTISMNASFSESFMNGLYFLDGNMHVDNHTLVNHATPNCYSNELYKGVLTGRSTGVFNGKIVVKQDAQKTNAFQSNRNVLLSKDSVMNTKPQLEIFADDVKCSHGATIGQLEEEPLFYLRSRGLSEKKAKALLTLAFAEEVLERIKLEPVKEALKEVLFEKFNNI